MNNAEALLVETERIIDGNSKIISSTQAGDGIYSLSGAFSPPQRLKHFRYK